MTLILNKKLSIYRYFIHKIMNSIYLYLKRRTSTKYALVYVLKNKAIQTFRFNKSFLPCENLSPNFKFSENIFC